MRRILGVSDTVANVEPPDEPLALRVDALDERLDFLQGQLNRLRGAVTGAIRRGGPPAGDPQWPQDAPGPTNGPPAGLGVSPSTWARLDPAARERLIQRRGRAVQNG